MFGDVADAVVMTPLALGQQHMQSMVQQPQPGQQQLQQQAIVPKPGTTVVAMDVMEQKQWWHLEEVSG